MSILPTMDSGSFHLYNRRALDVALQRIRTSPVVVLEGPRTVGKSTLLQKIAGHFSAHIVDLDDVAVRDQVESDPHRFLGGPRPVLIDEYLRLPPLLGDIKAQLNRDGSPGQFVLTGSADGQSNPEGLEALVGRLAGVEILPLSQIEIEGLPGNFVEAAFHDMEEVMSRGRSHTSRSEYVERVLGGGFPRALLSRTSDDRNRVFDSYIGQSLDYGRSTVSDIRQPADMRRLLFRYGAQTGQLLNIANAARDIGITTRTAENYTRLLELLFFVFRLPAWKPTDRGPVSRPKLHLVDSGVASRILRLTPERATGADPLFQTSFGHLLETFVVGEIRKAISWLDESFEIGYRRTRGGVEVDLVVERFNTGTVMGIEVKSAARISKADTKGLIFLRQELGSRFHAGIVFYMGDMPYQLAEDIYAVPIDKLWHYEPATPGQPRFRQQALLTADRDPLHPAVRDATEQMVEKLQLGKSALWELAIVPSANVSFPDFYSSDGVAGALKNVTVHSLRGGIGDGLGVGWEVEPINQCMAIVEKGRRGVLIHPLGTMVAVAAGTDRFLGQPYRTSRSRLAVKRWTVREWALEFARFAYRVLLPHGTGMSWTYWSGGRSLRTSHPQLLVLTSEVNKGVVDHPPHRGVPLTGDPEVDAYYLISSFYEWFGVPTADLAEAIFGRVSAEDIRVSQRSG